MKTIKERTLWIIYLIIILGVVLAFTSCEKEPIEFKEYCIDCYLYEIEKVRAITDNSNDPTSAPWYFEYTYYIDTLNVTLFETFCNYTDYELNVLIPEFELEKGWEYTTIYSSLSNGKYKPIYYNDIPYFEVDITSIGKIICNIQ